MISLLKKIEITDTEWTEISTDGESEIYVQLESWVKYEFDITKQRNELMIKRTMDSEAFWIFRDMVYLGPVALMFVKLKYPGKDMIEIAVFK